MRRRCFDVFERFGIGVQDGTAFGLPHLSTETRPGIGQQLPCVFEEPVHIRLTGQKDTAQNQTETGLAMPAGVGQRQRRAPGATEDQPAFDMQMRSQAFDVVDQGVGVIVLALPVGPAFAATALIEQADAVTGWIEKATLTSRFDKALFQETAATKRSCLPAPDRQKNWTRKALA